MIVDDHDLTLYAIKAVTEEWEDIELVGSFFSAEDAIVELERNHADVVMMDIRMPGLDGIEACQLITSRFSASRVLMMTHYNHEENFLSSVQAGASGYISKSANSAEFLRAIRRVANGQHHIDVEAFEYAFAGLKLRDDTRVKGVLSNLSKREEQVLILIGKGLTNREIGQRLLIAETTVRNHVTRLFSKAGFANRAEAAAFAARYRLAES